MKVRNTSIVGAKKRGRDHIQCAGADPALKGRTRATPYGAHQAGQSEYPAKPNGLSRA